MNGRRRIPLIGSVGQYALMLFLVAIALLAGHDFELFSTAAAFTDPTTGRLLQMDGIFFRPDEPVGRVAPGWYGS